MRSLRKSFGARGVVAMEAEELEQQEARQREEDEARARGEGGDATTTDQEDESTGSGEELLPEESTSENVETELMDATDASAEVDDQVDQVEEAEDVVEAMEAYVELMKTAAEQGGLDRHGARAVQIGLEQLYGRVGLTPSKLMPAMESYGGVSSRIGATQIAMEEVKEQVKKVWEAIVAAFTRLMNWVKDMYAKFVKSAEATKGRADRLIQAAQAAKGEHEEEIDNERTAAGIALGTDVDAEKAVEVLAKANEQKSKVIAGLAKVLGTAKSLLDKKGDFGDYHTAFEDALKIDGDKIVFPGNVEFGFVKSESGMEPEFKNVEANVPSKFKALSSEEAKQVAEKVIEISNKLIGDKEEVSKVLSESNSFLEKMKGLVNSTEDNASAKGMVSAVQKLINKTLSGLDRQILISSKHLLDVVEASIRGHKGEKKEEKPAEQTPAEKTETEKKDEKAAA